MVTFSGQVLDWSVEVGPEGAEVRRYSIRRFGFPDLKPQIVYGYWPISKGTIPPGAVARYTRGAKPYYLDPTNVTILDFRLETPLKSH